MALIFPSTEDTLKVRTYHQIDVDTPNFFNEVKKAYEKMNEEVNKHRSKTLEDKLTWLAIEWADASNKKRKEKINYQALKLIQGCCKLKQGFSSEAKEYYRTYRNMRRILAGEKTFYII